MMLILRSNLVLVLLATKSSLALPPGFTYISDIDDTILISARYATPQNFIHQIVDGYLAPTAICTDRTAYALSAVQNKLRRYGYSLVVYDAYRPTKAVDNFVKWAQSPQDNKTKEQFYPFLDKSEIFPDYVAVKSGHSRGSTVDLTIIPIGSELHAVVLKPLTLKDGSEILYRDDGSEFMGVHFDYFGAAASHDSPLVDDRSWTMRNFLRQIMQQNGFQAYQYEWWHYTLIAEPFPSQYFDFDVQ